MKTSPVTRRLEETRYRLTREVRDNPLLCLGLAIGVGAVIGALGSRTATPSPHTRTLNPEWLTRLTNGLSDEARQLTKQAAQTRCHAKRELNSVARHASDSLPEIDLDQLVTRGRDWLRSTLRA